MILEVVIKAPIFMGLFMIFCINHMILQPDSEDFRAIKDLIPSWQFRARFKAKKQWLLSISSCKLHARQRALVYPI